MTGRYQHRTGIINVLGQLSEAMAQMERDIIASRERAIEAEQNGEWWNQ